MFKNFLKKIFSPILLGNCLGMVLLAFLLGYGALCYLDNYTLHGQSVEVPDLSGVDAYAAMEQLQALGLQGEIADTGYVESMPGGSVLEQNIQSGSEVKAGRKIYLVINDWQPREVMLPDGIINNCSKREAELRLKARGFKIAPAKFIRGDKNWVYEIMVNGKQVQAGVMISPKHPLTLVVGDGSIEEEYNGNDTLWMELVKDSASVEAVPPVESAVDVDELFE